MRILPTNNERQHNAKKKNVVHLCYSSTIPQRSACYQPSYLSKFPVSKSNRSSIRPTL